MSENENTGSGLGGTFGSKTKGSQISYGHPQSKEILAHAREIMKESPTGEILLKVMDHHRIPVHILKGAGESGFSPDLNVIYLKLSGNIESAKPSLVLNLVKALREADLEYSGNKAPDPMKDLIEYAGFIHARNLAALTTVCKFIKELTNSVYFQDLLDILPKLGLNGVYKAYINGATKEELYMEYAEAYNSRGS